MTDSEGEKLPYGWRCMRVPVGADGKAISDSDFAELVADAEKMAA